MVLDADTVVMADMGVGMLPNIIVAVILVAAVMIIIINIINTINTASVRNTAANAIL